MSVATLDDRFVHYEVLGRGEPVILIHGWLGSWRYWWPSMQALAVNHRTFAYDLWGFGDSSKEPERYFFEAYIDMLDQFLGKLGMVRPVNLVGHTLGAAVAVEFGHRFPERVARIAAIGLPLDGSHIHEKLAASEPDAALTRLLGVDFPEVSLELRKTDPFAFSNLVRELSERSFREQVRCSQKPLLLVYGGSDPLVRSPDNGLREPHRRRALILLEDGQHFPMLENSLKFNRLLLDFFHAGDDLTSLALKEHWQRRNR